MHPSRQALLKGNSPSYDSPPHLSPQNRNQGQQNYGNSNNNFRQSSGSFGGGGGMMGSSTNTIPLAGRGRWGGGAGGSPSPARSNVSFENINQGGREQGHQQENRKQSGWGERSGGQVGLRGSRTEANGGGGGDIWQTIPVEDDTKEDQGWGTTTTSVSGQENAWGATNAPSQKDVPSQFSRADDGWGAPAPTATTDAQYQTSGWDVPAPRAHPKPRSNTSSQRSQQYRQAQIQSPSPHAQQPRQHHQQTPHRQEPMADIQTPIRTESSGWYDYASPPPSFSKASQIIDPRPPASNQASGISGWGGERQNRAIQIKDPNETSSTQWGNAPPPQPTSNASGGWATPSRVQKEISPASPISVIQQQGGWDAPKPEESIQRWTREVGQSKSAQEDEVDGMDIEDTGGICDDDEEKSVKANDGRGESKVKVEQWRSGPKEDGSEEPKVDDGWGTPTPAGAAGWGGGEARDDTEVQHNSGWGQSGETTTESNDNNNAGWGQPQSTNNNPSPSNGDGWGTPRDTRTTPTTDRETAHPVRSPMDQRQPITQAAKGMIQRHLQNPMRGPASMRSTSGEGAGRRSGGVNNLPERAAPQSNPFDVAAGDIWSSLPALDDAEVIKPPSDSELDAGSFKSASSKGSSMKDEPTRFRPESRSVTHKDEPKRIGRMSLASSDDAGSIHAHPAEKDNTRVKGTGAPLGAFTTLDEASNQSTTTTTIQPPPMLIDFDAPEEPYPSMTSAPSSTLTYSSTLIDMDDMLDLKTPITSPDRKVVGLDQYHPSKGYSGDFASMAGGSGFQNALDLGQLAKMFENGYPGSGRQQ